MTKIIDLFAGAGGFGLGFSLAGNTILTSVEFDKWAGETLKRNFDHNVIIDDISNIQLNKNILKSVLDTPNMIIGGPPCQGFSNAGTKNSSDPRNSLYNEYLKWVIFFRPSVFIIENVVGILKNKQNGNYIVDDIKDRLSLHGYKISTWKLNAVNFGVPQSRVRAFIVGSLKHSDIPPPNIEINKDKFISVGEAILDLPIIFAGEGDEKMEYTITASNEYQKTARKNSNNVNNHVAMNHTPRVVKRYQEIINGNSLLDLDDELKVRKRSGNGKLSDIHFGSNYRLLNENLPSFTIPAHFYSSFIHPKIPRNLTAREAARIQSFPDNYVFKGKRTMMSKSLLNKLGKESHLSQYNQIGNAVPPLLAKQIAIHIEDYL